VPLVESEPSRDLDNSLELPHFCGPARLLVIARDPWTMVAYWNVDWPAIFKTSAPIDRQVHLRIHCADGLEEREAAVEPTAGMHHVTMSQRYRTCCVEMGYYQPAAVWHSVAVSNEIIMPSSEIAEAEPVDLATIPFHLSFQRLAELFGAANDDALATAISRFQTDAVSSGKGEKLSPEERKILRRGGVALSEIAEAWGAFKQIDSEALRKRSESLLESGSSSPSRAFEGDWTLGSS
jgi:Domain of unknown function (DUF4912)